jgi:hypothetical protein
MCNYKGKVKTVPIVNIIKKYANGKREKSLLLPEKYKVNL